MNAFTQFHSSAMNTLANFSFTTMLYRNVICNSIIENSRLKGADFSDLVLSLPHR